MQKYIKYCSFGKTNHSFFKRILGISLFALSHLVTSNVYANDTAHNAKTEKAITPPPLPEKINPILKTINGFEALGKFKDWESFAMITPDEVVCWISSSDKQAGKNKNIQKKQTNIIQSSLKKSSKKPSILMLSIRLENEQRDEFSYYSSHSIEAEGRLHVKIDDLVGFKLSPQGHWAWLQSTIDESRFVLAAQKGTNLTLTGKDTHDKPIYETYSLSGFTAAYKSAFEACSNELKNKNGTHKADDTQKAQ